MYPITSDTRALAATADDARVANPENAAVISRMPRRAGGWIGLLLVPALAAPTGASFEPEPVLHAAAVIASPLLSGPGYSVDARVPVVGYQAQFRLRTPYGEIVADSVEMLAIRVAEMPALVAVHDARVSELMARSAIDTVQNRGRELSTNVRHPVQTLARLPKGVARYFVQRWHNYRERARKLGDRARRELAQEGSAFDDARGPMSAPRANRSSARNWHDKPRREIVNLTRGEFNHARARRAWAQRLGIDPDTSNPLIRPRLDALAWGAAGAQWVADFAISLSGAGIDEALRTSSRVHDAVWALDPAEVRARNRARISPWCNDEILLRAFLRHRAFSPQLQTVLSESVRALAPAEGCSALLETALMATNEQEARFVANAASLLRHHLGNDERSGRFVPVGATLAYRTSEDELFVPLAVDVLTWNPSMQYFFDLPTMRAGSRTVLVTGSISIGAQRALTERGWSLVSNLPYPNAPPYALSPARPLTLAQRTCSDAGRSHEDRC